MEQILRQLRIRQVQLLALFDSLVFILLVFDIVNWTEAQVGAITAFNALLLGIVIGPQQVNQKQFVDELNALAAHPANGPAPSEDDVI